MTREILKESIEKALRELQHHDNHLLKNNGSERSIAHCLANHLQKIYADYHVDCEYNVNVDAANRRKEIILPADEILRFRRSETNRNSIEVDDEIYYSVSVYPDIIVHKRGRNDKNLIIFELKKSSSTVSYDYDKLKLCKYTGVFERSLRYEYGVFINIHTKLDNGYKFEVKIFENGEEKEEYSVP
ncbi:MAG: hypothetical protein PHN18_10545 [Sulfurospirillaceae bacterium]|nr:hypothetical protein [Sulfurospirillaceae bacterium]MDD2827421.1 hypothetical protein [Sulfurospirillaceae bacterium]